MTSASVFPRARVLAMAVVAALLALVAVQLMTARPAGNAGAAAGGVHITMTVTGAKTGNFKGDDGGRANIIKVLAYQYELQAPTDISSGGGAGKVVHKPVTITHLLGGSSPEFLFAAATGEDLTKVQIDFSRVNPNGTETVYYRVILTNAVVTDVKQYSAGDNVREDIEFLYRKIEQKSLTANTDFIANVVTAT
jgi:type VI secretion system Hcp family effector